MRVIGIGTRRPKAKLASGLEPLTRSDIFLVKCRTLDRVKGIIVLRQYIDLKNHLDNLIDSKKTVDILEKLLGDNEPSEKIFVAIKDYFKLINKFSQQKTDNKIVQGKLAQIALFWKIIYWSGYFPRFCHCTYCDRKMEERDSYNFILSHGINCGCQKNNSSNLQINLNKNVIKLIKFLASQDMKYVQKFKINSDDFQDLKQFTKLILEQITERRVEI